MSYKKIMANIIAQEILDSGIKIPSLPASAPRLLAMAQQSVEQIEINVLEDLIKSDPILCVQILKLANSPYYNSGMEITGLRKAIMNIGLTETIHSLYMYIFKSILPPFPNLNGFSDKEYWEEALACAVANRRLGDPGLLVKALPGELYIAGLLQGIGKLILSVYDPKAFEKCINISRNTGQTFGDVELEIFGTTDDLIAYKILESWHLPSMICAAVGYWQAPESAASEYREIAGLTQFACSVVRISGLVGTCEWIGYSSTDSFIADLSNIYIFKNSSSPLAGTGKQYQLVQEIVSILEKKFTASQESKEKKMPQKTEFKNLVRHDVVNDASGFPAKKDFFNWIRSFF
ncbi:MAG: HDOD domain-containing protein [Desulfamplus sp.]|nr:HDOD domain-containing protein [Desulfamplus sp.]